MEKFTETESVTWKCEDCAHAHADNLWQTPATKQLTIARHPKLLCLHLHRLIQHGHGNLMKVDSDVHFPTSMDTLPYSSYFKGMFASSHETYTATTDILASLPELRPPGTSQHTLNSSFLSSSRKNSKNPQDSQKPIYYSLVAVICHLGSAYGGHYIVYKRLLTEQNENEDLESGNDDLNDKQVLHEVEDADLNEKNGKKLILGQQWVCISDGSWELVSEMHVLQQNAYLLFYERGG